MNSHRGYIVAGDYKKGGLFQEVFKISWGEPAKIALCRMDDCCPECGETGNPQYDKSVKSNERVRLIGGMDIIKENGVIIAACCSCGWSF